MVHRKHEGVSILQHFTQRFIEKLIIILLYLFREDVSQSNKSSVKSFLETGNNGNGVTPPESPRRCSSPKSRTLSQKIAKNSSVSSKFKI